MNKQVLLCENFMLIFYLFFLNYLFFFFSCFLFYRVCEYISTLEHTHFCDGTSQLSLTITQAQQVSMDVHGLSIDASQEYTTEQEASLGKSPVIQPVPIQDLIKESSKGRAFDFRGNSLMSSSNAAKAVCTLSTQVDK